MENIIWLVLAALGVISTITNKGKTKSDKTPSSMPTFGGNGEGPSHPETTRESYDSDKNLSPGPDYHTGEDVSQMWQDTSQDRNHEMQKEIDRVTAAFDKIAAPPSNEWNAYDNSDEELKESNSSRLSDQAINGIIWSEILGPPRAKRPYHNRQS